MEKAGSFAPKVTKAEKSTARIDTAGLLAETVCRRVSGSCSGAVNFYLCYGMHDDLLPNDGTAEAGTGCPGIGE
ncbi:MAG: hypothetical protein Q4C66_03225 [Lachnospiraceae bacterium]|nr:hypothetical protein [Lachnospiraceae bacterium]